MKDWIIAFIVFCIFMISIVLLMHDYWIWAMILGIPSLLLLGVFFSELIKPTNNYVSSKDNYYSSGYVIWLETRKGYTKYEMVGMYYRKLRSSDIGKFEGYVKAEINNQHDRYAVAIYNNNRKHMGYLPAGNKSIHSLIVDNDGILPAHGYISYNPYLKDYTAEVGIKTNIS